MATASRIDRTKEKFAHLLGGIDADGTEHKLVRDPKDLPEAQNRHLFAVRHKDDEYPAWHFVRGFDAAAKIKEDYWEIVYIGKVSECSYKDSKGKVRFTNKKYVEYLIKQAADLVGGQKTRDLKTGTIYEDAHYERLLAEKVEDIESRLDKEKQT